MDPRELSLTESVEFAPHSKLQFIYRLTLFWIFSKNLNGAVKSGPKTLKKKKSRLDFDYKLLLNANIDKESIIKKTSLQTKKLFSKSGMKKYKPRVIMAQVRQEVTTKQLPMMFMKSTKKYI